VNARRRHEIVWKILQFTLTPYIKWKFNYQFDKVKPLEYPTIILPNHLTNWDPLLVGTAFSKMMYYVASDHLFRLGWISKIIEYLVDPIPRMKSTRDRKTVVAMLRRLREGNNICIFPEGNMSFSGETGQLHETTAKLVKYTGAALITYRMEGGYLTQPRWSKYPRRGVMTGRVVNIYTPEEIKTLSEEELMKRIERDLYTNAYEEQERLKSPIAFHGKKLAESLETALYLCPSCNQIGTLVSKDNIFCCPCGLQLRFTPYGYFESLTRDKPPFTRILDWFRWQHKRTRELAEQYRNKKEDYPITSDENQTLWRIQKARNNSLLSKGTLKLFRNRLCFQGSNGYVFNFPFNQISDLAIHGSRTIIFSTTDQEYYELKSKAPRSGLKYYELFKALTDKPSIYERKG
jgi:1-acyl-sn-glycerol-3-phosphate acyltransferase